MYGYSGCPTGRGTSAQSGILPSCRQSSAQTPLPSGVFPSLRCSSAQSGPVPVTARLIKCGFDSVGRKKRRVLKLKYSLCHNCCSQEGHSSWALPKGNLSELLRKVSGPACRSGVHRCSCSSVLMCGTSMRVVTCTNIQHFLAGTPHWAAGTGH